MTTFWLNNPSILLSKDSITQIWPTPDMNSIQKLNAITRLVVLLTILGFFVSRTLKVIITGIITLGAIILLHYVQNNNLKTNSIKEQFVNSKNYNENKQLFSESQENNPLMNVSHTQIHEEANRQPAAPTNIPEIEEQINNNTKKMIINKFNDKTDIDEKLFKDLGDSYNFEHSMRNWYSTPNTQIPNDQKGFADFCYGDMSSCKEGDALACSKTMPPRIINM